MPKKAGPQSILSLTWKCFSGILFIAGLAISLISLLEEPSSGPQKITGPTSVTGKADNPQTIRLINILNHLAIAQQTYSSEHSTYTTSWEDLGKYNPKLIGHMSISLSFYAMNMSIIKVYRPAAEMEHFSIKAADISPFGMACCLNSASSLKAAPCSEQDFKFDQKSIINLKRNEGLLSGPPIIVHHIYLP